MDHAQDWQLVGFRGICMEYQFVTLPEFVSELFCSSFLMAAGLGSEASLGSSFCRTNLQALRMASVYDTVLVLNEMPQNEKLGDVPSIERGLIGLDVLPGLTILELRVLVLELVLLA